MAHIKKIEKDKQTEMFMSIQELESKVPTVEPDPERADAVLNTILEEAFKQWEENVNKAKKRKRERLTVTKVDNNKEEVTSPKPKKTKT